MSTGRPTPELDPQVIEIAKTIGSSAKTVPEVIDCEKFKGYIEKVNFFVSTSIFPLPIMDKVLHLFLKSFYIYK